MKNSILIDIDSEREKKIIIGKPDVLEKPETPEEAKSMIIKDITDICEVLCELIHIADQSGYAKKSDLVNAAIDSLNQFNNESNVSSDITN
jgi:hypothetical protein